VKVKVRAARSAEWERARDLRLRALTDDPDAFGSTLERELESAEPEWRAWIDGWEGSTNRFIVGETRDGWVGMAVGSRSADEPDAHLYGMWVDPAWRGRGVGGSLVHAVVDWARSWGARAVLLGVTERNDGAARFYERLGFEDTGERHLLREDGSLLTRVFRLEL
jgi:GNAT superfamily N-acetyltransferase